MERIAVGLLLPLTDLHVDWIHDLHGGCSRALVVKNLGALDGDVLVGLDVDLSAAALNRHVLAFDDDRAVASHGDAGVAGLDGDRVARLEDVVLRDLGRIVHADPRGAGAPDLAGFVAADGHRQSGGNIGLLSGAHVDGPGPRDLGGLTGADVGRLNRADIDHLCGADVDHLRGTDGDRLAGADRMSTRRANGVGFGEGNRRRLHAVDGVGARAIDRDVLAGVHRLGPVRPDGDGLVGAHGLGPVLIDVDGLVLDDVLRLIAAHRLRVVDVDLVRAAVVDRGRLVVLDDRVHVELAVDEHALLAGGVVQRHLVEARPLVRVGFHAADHRAGREPEGRQLLRVVDAADDERLVGIAFEEADDDLLADARRRDRAPPLAGPGG